MRRWRQGRDGRSPRGAGLALCSVGALTLAGACSASSGDLSAGPGDPTERGYVSALAEYREAVLLAVVPPPVGEVARYEERVAACMEAQGFFYPIERPEPERAVEPGAEEEDDFSDRAMLERARIEGYGVFGDYFSIDQSAPDPRSIVELERDA